MEEKIQINEGSLRPELGEHITLTRGQRGGCGWDIKVVCMNGERIDEEFIKRLEKYNNMMITRFTNSGFEDPEPMTPKKFSPSFKDEFKE